MENLSRRSFLISTSKVIAFIPYAGMLACAPDLNAKFSAEEALKRLIYILGPWELKDHSLAVDFTERFLLTNHANQYLPKAADLIQSLSNQISNETMAAEELDISTLPLAENELLLNLTELLYSFVDIRFYVSNEPPWGLCQGDPNWHTRVPEET